LTQQNLAELTSALVKTARVHRCQAKS